MSEEKPPGITPLVFKESDFPLAEIMAKKLGFTQTAYTSTSGLWGLFCLKDNPATRPAGPKFDGCIIKTKEFGLLFVADAEDLGIDA